MANEIMVANENTNVANTSNDSNFEIPRGFICTVDITTMQGKLDVMNALNGAEPLSKRMNETLILKNVVTKIGARAVTGEECINTYLILDDGSALFSQSVGVLDSITIMVGLFTQNGVCDFGEGIPIKCIERPLRNGNTLKVIVPARD